MRPLQADDGARRWAFAKHVPGSPHFDTPDELHRYAGEGLDVEDGCQSNVSYPSPAEVARRCGLDADLAAALETIDTRTTAVVNRKEEARSSMLNEFERSTASSLPWRVEEAHAAEVELERARWKAITAFVELLSEDERLAPGYYSDPDWSVKDLIAHLGAWMAEARVQLLDIAARSYVPHEVDVDARNAATLAATKAEPWERVWARTKGARAWMLEAWFGLSEPDEAANQWVRKAGAEHYGEHLGRLREWVAELVDLRTRPKVDERDP